MEYTTGRGLGIACSTLTMLVKFEDVHWTAMCKKFLLTVEELTEMDKQMDKGGTNVGHPYILL
jgi:hypothetical protein